MKNIKVLGRGCKKCALLAEETQKALNSMAVDLQVEKVEDSLSILRYNVLSTPALVVDEKVVLSGKVLKQEALEELLKSL